jgi:predicted heme/steroid binding protein
MIIILMLVLLMTACGYQAEEATTEEVVVSEEMSTYTLEELAIFTGEDGNAAYVAIDGVVYDVTGLSAWTDGKHNGNVAGKDLSEVIGNAPHGKSKLKNLTIVGYLEK